MAGMFGSRIGSGEGKKKAKNLLEAADQFAKSSAGSSEQGPAEVTGPTVPEELDFTKLNRPGGNEAPDFGSPGFVPISPIDIEESGVLSEVGDVTSELLSGELPEDVVKSIEKTSAELGISTGVFGQASEFSTANALGLTSLDLVSAGIESGLSLGQIETQRNVAQADITSKVASANQQASLAFSQLQEQARQWEDSMALSMIEAKLNVDQLTLRTAELVSTNQRHLQTLENNIIIANSTNEIGNAQQVIDDMAEFMGTTDAAILKLMGINVG